MTIQGSQRDPHIARMLIKFESKFTDQNQDEVKPEKLVEIADEVRDELFKEQNDKSRALKTIINATSSNA